MTLQLLATKTQMPPTRPHLVARQRLFQRLDDGLVAGNGLFFVSAPAGYGKTTLLTDWILHLGRRPRALGSSAPEIHSAWLTLDEGDNDPSRFLSYLAVSLQKVDAALGQRLLDAIPRGSVPGWNDMLPLYVNELAAFSGPVLLVLDDYHTICAQTVHDIVAWLLDYMPANLHLVIASRTDPPLSLARLRGRGRVSELHLQDLRFDVGEAHEFLSQVMGLPLGAHHSAALSERTEGWVAGLQMAAVSLQGRSDLADIDAFVSAFTGSNRQIMDYLSEEVYRRQPSEVRRFLLRTSILERFNATLCSIMMVGDVLLDEDRPWMELAEATGATVVAQRLLERIEHANLFVVPLDDERNWYRYHHLFADILRQRLYQEHPGAAAALHLRASLWYEQQQFAREAVQHALAARCFDRAADLIERAAEATMMASEVATLRSWVESLPAATLQLHPMLCLYDAGAMLLAGERTEVAEARLREGLANGERGKVGGQMAIYQALAAMFQGHAAQSAMLAQRSLELLPQRSPFFRSMASLILALSTLLTGDDESAAQRLHETLALSDQVGNVMNSVLARSHLAELAILRNQLVQAETLYREALAIATRSDEHEPVRGVPLTGLGTIEYERNELTKAQNLLEEGIEALRGWGQVGMVQACVVLYKVRRALGDRTGAENMLHAAEELAARGQMPAAMLGSHVLFHRMQAAIDTGDMAEVDRYAEMAGVTVFEHPGELAGPVPVEKCYIQLARTRWLRAHGYGRDALPILEVLRQIAVRQGRERLELQVLLGQALTHFELKQHERALAALDSALELAEAAGTLRLVVEAGGPMAELLRLGLHHAVHPGFSERLLAALAADGYAESAVPVLEDYARTARSSLDSSILALSPRELQVLELAAQGMTNVEIAADLTIGLSTVKTHVNHICRKLDAPNRTSAAAKARRLGWLIDE